MKQQDIKNKMDQIGHDFDQDLLWANIQQQKDKKKRSIFFWFFPIGGMLIFVAALFYLNTNKPNEIDERRIETLVVNEEENKTQKANSKELNINDDNNSNRIETAANQEKKEQFNTKYKNQSTESQNKAIDNSPVKTNGNHSKDKKNTTINNVINQASAEAERVSSLNPTKDVVAEKSSLEAKANNYKSGIGLSNERTLFQITQIALLPLEALKITSNRRLLKGMIIPLKKNQTHHMALGFYTGIG